MINSYVAVDLETTGLDPKRDKITEIGAVKVIDGKIVGEYTSLVYPRRELNEKTTTLTGITDEMLKDAPSIEDIIETVIDFFGDFPVLGHQIIFDYSFLKRAAVNRGRQFDRAGIDTLKLCRHFMPKEEKKNLSAACTYYRVNIGQAHRALSDAYAAHYLYQALLSRYQIEEPEKFSSKILVYKVKKEQMATKRQKDHLHDLLKYHKINLSMQIDHLSRNEISRVTDQIISRMGSIKGVNTDVKNE